MITIMVNPKLAIDKDRTFGEELTNLIYIIIKLIDH